MNLQPIDPYELTIRPHYLFDRQTLLLTAGDFTTGDFNCMTIGWGAIGTMWNHPFVQIVVRPHRYTYLFTEKYPDFTVTAFPKEYKKDLAYLGTRSGRDENKLLKTNLTPVASHAVASPSYAQAELSIECRKVYAQDFDPDHFIDPSIHERYPLKDYHRVYYGEIVAVYGTAEYVNKG